MHPLPNPYLHAAVGLGVAIQMLAAWWPPTAVLLGNVWLPGELWLLVGAASIVSWAPAEGVSRVAWRAGRSPAA